MNLKNDTESDASNFEINTEKAGGAAGNVNGDQISAETYIHHINNSTSVQNGELDSGRGGHGGGGNATGKWSKVIGGRGGAGGDKKFGSGGYGGGGDAVGDHSMVIGGDGGDAPRSDGRGGVGGISPLKKLSKEKLHTFGLSGYEGYGQGGRGQNSFEYDQALKVLCQISAEYFKMNPDETMLQMPGVLMPPVEWVNSYIEEIGEIFRVKLINNDTDFLIQLQE